MNNLGSAARVSSENRCRIAFDPSDSRDVVFVDSYSAGALLRIGVRSAMHLRSAMAAISEDDDYAIGASGGRLLNIWRFC